MTNELNNTPSFLVVIGASAGGLNALCEMVAGLQADTDAAYLVVLHLSGSSLGDFLVSRLQQHSMLPCQLAVHEQPIMAGRVYIAPAGRHLLVDESATLLGNGPLENRWRPSVNNLFRSAAASWGSRVIGIILTGYLDDGTAGMSAVKRTGGYTIVQDPNQAEFPDMPLSVLDSMQVDFCLPLSDIAPAIHELVAKGPRPAVPVPEDVRIESSIDRRVATGPAELQAFGRTEFNCPDCGGGLWQTLEKGPGHLRCHVGHSFTVKDLNGRQAQQIEATLWTALRMMEERKALLQRIQHGEAKKGLMKLVASANGQSEELQQHIDTLKQVLFELHPK